MKHSGAIMIVICLSLVVLSCGESKESKVTSADVKKETKEAYETAVEYTKQQKEEFQKKMQAKLDEYRKRIYELRVDTDEMSTQVQARVKRRLQDLEAKREAAEEKLGQLESSSGKAWAKIKEGLDQSMKDLDQAYEDARSQFN
jgi:predicted secreted Zn-dependent protease